MNQKITSVAIVCAMLLMGITINIDNNVDAAFVNNMPVPWGPDFTPTDSAWDSSGNNLVVVGNDTSGIQSSAWHYDSVLDTWSQIFEGADINEPQINTILNVNTSMSYTTIQSAIDAASPGEFLRVWTGTYNESIVIDKPLTLEGNGSINTIIDGGGSGTVVTIKTSNVSFKGFTVTGGAISPGYAGILVYNVQDIIIENNTVTNCYDGIRLDGASNNIVTGNNIENNQMGLRTRTSDVTNSLAGVTGSGGLATDGTLLKMDTSGSNYSILHDFKPGYIDGTYPYYTQFARDGNILYGTTQSGGAYGRGTLFKINANGTGRTILHEFSNVDGQGPYGGVILDGTTLYGMTYGGGTFNLGVVYKINTDGNGFSVLHNSDNANGSRPYGSLLQYGTTLYGMTNTGGNSGLGTIFKLDIDGTGFSVMHHFNGTVYDGRSPYGSLVSDGTMLYGMTYYGGSSNLGTIFRIKLDGSLFKLLQNFTGANGQNPFGSLTLSGTNLYGMTYSGGYSSLGTVFNTDIDGSFFNVMHDFNGTNGQYPYGSLVYDGFWLYGMTYGGGDAGLGAVFHISNDALTFNVLHNFTGADGQYPRGSLVLDDSMTLLYGMTYSGGTDNYGTIFEIANDGSSFTKLHDFLSEKVDGINPYGNVIQAGAYLYGMTYGGGSFGYGSIYKIRSDGYGFSLLHSFDSTDGSYPYGSLVLDGTILYGMTASGGSNAAGVIFKIDTNGTGYTVMHHFTGGATDGSRPYGSLLMDGNLLHGMTYVGGANDTGTIFSIDKNWPYAFSLRHSFAASPGPRNPYGSLLLDGTTLYGMTRLGNTTANDFGTVFKINNDGTGFNVMANFTGADTGSWPYGSLVTDGSMLYGMTYSGGAYNNGAIFKIDKTTLAFTLMRSLNGSLDGSYPYGSLILNGSVLYGMTYSGGPNNYGTAFRINKDTSVFSKLHDFESTPYDGAYPLLSDLLMIQNLAQPSTGNLIYHNNFITNANHSANDGTNFWDNGLPDGGNYWDNYTDVDSNSDGIWDTAFSIAIGGYDNYPWARENGWKIPYTSFTSVAWDNVNQRFWICGEYSPDAQSTFYYIPVNDPTTMVPVSAPPNTFTALAVDVLGNLLIGGNDLQFIYYYETSTDKGYGIGENGTGSMYGWNITSITFNPGDNRFYFVGNVKDADTGVAFFTESLPLNTTGKKCYIDNSDFMNFPGIGGLKSISWNPSKNYSLAVGDGVYRLNPYTGTDQKLSWSIIEGPSAGITYRDVSWDSDGWNEAGIAGDDNSFGSYWRYYHTNPTLQNGFTNSTAGTEYTTCAMKPPASPKWLAVLGASGGIQVNIQELDQSTAVSASLVNPNIYWVGFNDTALNPMNNQMVNPDSWFNIVFEGNYSGGWNSLRANITFWYDGGSIGTASQYPVENDGNRNIAFFLTYEPALGIYSINYPTAPVLETTIGNVSDTITWNHPSDAAQSFHRVELQVHLGAQMLAADGNGFSPTGPDYAYDPNIALDNPNSWDFNITLEDIGDSTKFNSTYAEFGVNKAISISITGNPSGDGAPGDNGVALGSSVINYSTNTQYWVNVSIPDLYLNGDITSSSLINASNIQVQNINGLANSGTSDMAAQVYFAGADIGQSVWGLSSPVTSLSSPGNGTTAHGPWGSNYNYAGDPGGTTSVNWYVDMPAGLAAGTYRATITFSIETLG